MGDFLQVTGALAHFHAEVKRNGGSRYVTIPPRYQDYDVVIIIKKKEKP